MISKFGFVLASGQSGDVMKNNWKLFLSCALILVLLQPLFGLPALKRKRPKYKVLILGAGSAGTTDLATRFLFQHWHLHCLSKILKVISQRCVC